MADENEYNECDDVSSMSSESDIEPTVIVNRERELGLLGDVEEKQSEPEVSEYL